jgi:hypothetical protein
MRLIALVLSLTLSFQVLAHPTQKVLNEVIDNYEYEMTVEWDQQDLVYSQAAIERLYQNLMKLSQEGLTEKDIVEVLSKKSLSSEQIEALKTQLRSMTAGARGPEELAKVISAYSKDLYQNGASWNGSVIVMAGVGVVAAALLGYSIWFSVNHTCVAYDQGQRCGWYSNYYGGPSYYQCWVETYCVQYVRN